MSPEISFANISVVPDLFGGSRGLNINIELADMLAVHVIPEVDAVVDAVAGEIRTLELRLVAGLSSRRFYVHVVT